MKHVRQGFRKEGKKLVVFTQSHLSFSHPKGYELLFKIQKYELSHEKQEMITYRFGCDIYISCISNLNNFSEPAGSDYLIAGFHWRFSYKMCEIHPSGTIFLDLSETKSRCCYYDMLKKVPWNPFSNSILFQTCATIYTICLALNYTFPLGFHSSCIRTVFSRSSCCHINPLCRTVGHVSSAFSISPLSSCLDLIPAVERLLGL